MKIILRRFFKNIHKKHRRHTMRKKGIPILLILCLVAHFSFAGTTGKIVGKVIDII